MRQSLRAVPAALALAVSLAACGGRTAVAPPTPAGATSGGTTSSDRRVIDARNVVDHGRVLHGVLTAPAATDQGGRTTASTTRRTSSAGTNLLYNSGPIYSLPQVAVVYWGFAGSGNDPNGEATYFSNFVSGMGGTWWSSTLTQYQNPSISAYSVLDPASYLVGTWYDTTNAVPATPTTSDIAAEAQRAVAHFGFWSNWNQINYVIATPTGHSTSDFAANGGPYCAWHSTTTYNGGATFPYTNFPYQSDAGSLCGQNFVNAGSAGTLDGVSIIGGHEIAEAVTDPQPTSGWADSTGKEIGDKCAWTNLANLSTRTGTFAVQPLWSNAITDCTQSYQSSAPTKTCTNDAYGYCLQVVNSHITTSYCSTGGKMSETISKQYLWNNGVYAGTYTLYHVPRGCPDGDAWDPTDPVTQNTDPTLP